MYADIEVMRDANGPLSALQSSQKMDRYVDAFKRHGFCRWAVDDRNGNFIGYVGVMPIPAHFPLAGFDIGWRFVKSAWGQGLASEAAAAALSDIFARTDLAEVFGYTTADNFRSQAVMRRLNFKRDPARDFMVEDEGFRWRSLVWVAKRG
jgi:RimJ/RimL family protein N-acetyltransferase